MGEGRDAMGSALAKEDQRGCSLHRLNGYTVVPPQAGEEVRRFFQVLGYHCWMILSVVLLALVLVASLLLVLPKEYEGVARLVIYRTGACADLPPGALRPFCLVIPQRPLIPRVHYLMFQVAGSGFVVLGAVAPGAE